MNKKTSRISGFYSKSTEERLDILKNFCDLSDKELVTLQSGIFPIDQASHMIENVISVYPLPFGIGTNFLINDTDYLIPLVIEEPSVVAAVSNAAKLFRDGGGFHTKSDSPTMIGQIQVLDIDDPEVAINLILSHQEKLLTIANEAGGSLVKRGGGARGIEVRSFYDERIGNMLIVHILFDTQDAMGANAINTIAERLAPSIEEITHGRVNLRILSNLADRRKAYAEGMIPAQSLARDGISGEEAVQYIVEAGVFAEIDPYRATTHNKGIMNGIDAIILATGNDWRAIEAGAHAYAVRDGKYSSLTKWWQDEEGNLRGSIELPMAVGTVGGATRVHPIARIAMKILGHPDARTLAEIVACVGLAQNLGAIRALAMEGIQNGHMRMHARQLAVAAGAAPSDVLLVAQRLIAEKNIRLQRAEEIVSELKQGQ